MTAKPPYEPVPYTRAVAYRPPLQAELASRVRRNLTANSLTQAMVARRVEASEKHVSRVLNGYDDGSIPFWDALLRESGYPRTSDEYGNEPAAKRSDAPAQQR